MLTNIPVNICVIQRYFLCQLISDAAAGVSFVICPYVALCFIIHQNISLPTFSCSPLVMVGYDINSNMKTSTNDYYIDQK